MTPDLINYIIYGIGGLIVTVLTVVSGCMGTKASKEKKECNNAFNWLEIINNLMPQLIVKYESIFTRGKGEDKKTLVLNELIKYCIDNKIEYNEEVLSNQIDTYITISKQINRGR